MDTITVTDNSSALSSPCSVKDVSSAAEHHKKSKDGVVENPGEEEIRNLEKHSWDAKEGSCIWKPPRRYIFSTLSFIACSLAVTFNTNLSITIVSMINRNVSVASTRASNECIGTAEADIDIKYGDFLWGPEMEGLAIGAAYYGQLVSFIPGGRLAELWGGKKTLISSMLLSSALTMLLPAAAYSSLQLFIALRFLIGVGTGPAIPVLFYLISHWIPLTERSFHASIILAGYGVGSFISFIVAGALCGTDVLGGWPSVFYVQGAAGFLWCVACYFLVFEMPLEHPTITTSELLHIIHGLEAKRPKQIKTIPWKSMATSLPIWALAVGYFGQFWILGFFCTAHALYMGTILNLNSVKNGQLSCLPHLIRAVFACICSYPADWALKKGLVGVAFIRKGATAINSLVSILGFIGIMLAGCDPVLNTVFFTIGGLLGDFVTFGVCMACIDIAPNLSGTVSGILSIIGVFPFFIIPAIVGWVTTYERTMAQWRLVYHITIAVIVVTTLAFVLFGSLDPQPWGTSTEDVEEEEKRKKHDQTIKAKQLQGQNT